jgi:4-hydroxy-tetrahydrodipicolinate synthase
MTHKLLWHGVYPATNTQFSEDFGVDIAATQSTADALIDARVHGLVVLGTCGENNSLEPEEKRTVLAATREVAAGRVPVVSGVSELTTGRAVQFARDAEKNGADGLMLLPAMVYVPTVAELEAHFRAVAEATSLPIMLYNNPSSYRVEITLDALDRLADVSNIVAVKEATPDPRRITDIINRFGDRYTIMAGLDDVALEGLILGATGWVSGLTSAFPDESVALYEAVQSGDLDTARAIYRWFMPLLHLDASHDLVQSIKLSAAMVGRGSERVRMPRMPLAGAQRDAVVSIVETAKKTRPHLDIRVPA